MLQNGLDRLHRAPGLIFDPVRMIVFGDDVRGDCDRAAMAWPEMNNSPQGLSTRIAGAYGMSTRRYDDVPMAALPSYGLTTIRQPVREIVKTAMEILGLTGDRGARSEPTTRLIPGTLITRSSTVNRRAVSHLKETAA
jgi:hypothetical protein